MKLVEVYNKLAHAEDTLCYFLCSDYIHILILCSLKLVIVNVIRSISVVELIKRDAK